MPSYYLGTARFFATLQPLHPDSADAVLFLSISLTCSLSFSRGSEVGHHYIVCGRIELAQLLLIAHPHPGCPGLCASARRVMMATVDSVLQASQGTVNVGPASPIYIGGRAGSPANISSTTLRSSTSANASSIVPPAPAVSGASSPSPYADFTPIPDSGRGPVINIYPRVEVDKEYRDRCDSIFAALHIAFLGSKVGSGITKRRYLRDYVSDIDLRPFVCGTSPSDSKPSIVVIIREGSKLRPMLERELGKKHNRRQFDGSRPGPSFPLYYFEGNPHTLAWNSGYFTFPQCSPNELSMCGTRIQALEQDRTVSNFATLTCLLEVQKQVYGFSVAHLFTNHSKEQDYEHDEVEDDAVFDEDDEDAEDAEDGEDADENDGKYEQTSTDLRAGGDGDMGTASVSPLSGHDWQKMPEVPSPIVEGPPAIYPGPNDLQTEKSDCDWAVWKITSLDQQLPNAYLADCSLHRSRKQRLCFPIEVADQRPDKNTSVHIIAPDGTKCGILTTGIAHLGGLSGRGPCQAWTVEMKAPHSMCA